MDNTIRSMATSGGAGAGAGAAAPFVGKTSPMVAPFVGKTYRMVDDLATDAVIAWGRDDSSFVVADPGVLSQTLLPAHFKHSNFTSFMRQLNTYGFRKVHPDRWEFAHASFLRGRTDLLPQIVRRKRKGDGVFAAAGADEEAAVAGEVVRLRREQRATEDQVAAMWRRVRETERRPKQVLAFLVKVAGDPQVLRRLASRDVGFASDLEDGGSILKRARQHQLDGAAAEHRGGGGSSSGGTDGGAVDFSEFFFGTGSGEDDVGFGSDFLQPPPYYDMLPVIPSTPATKSKRW